jgi:hypothetical protein
VLDVVPAGFAGASEDSSPGHTCEKKKAVAATDETQMEHRFRESTKQQTSKNKQ